MLKAVLTFKLNQYKAINWNNLSRMDCLRKALWCLCIYTLRPEQVSFSPDHSVFRCLRRITLQ